MTKARNLQGPHCRDHFTCDNNPMPFTKGIVLRCFAYIRHMLTDMNDGRSVAHPISL